MKTRFSFLVLLIMSLLTLTACGGGGGGGTTVSSTVITPVTNTSAGIIKGNVTSDGITTSPSKSGIKKAPPVEGAKVFLEDNPEISTLTDTQGDFLLKNVPIGKKNIIAEKSIGGKKFKIKSEEIEVKPQQITDIKELKVIESTNSMTGNIKDSVTSSNLSNVRVRVWGQTAMSDAYGNYKIYDMPQGSWQVIFNKDNYRTKEVIISFGAGEESKYDLTLTPNSVPVEDNPIIISDIDMYILENTRFFVRWKTNIDTVCQIYYGKTTNYGTITNLNPPAKKSHEVGQGTLEPGTIYHYKIIAISKDGVRKETEDMTFTTLTGINDNPVDHLSLPVPSLNYNTNRILDLSSITVKAHFKDGTSKNIVPKWSIYKANGILSGNIYTTGKETGTEILKASYTYLGSTPYIFFEINLTDSVIKTLETISLTPPNISLNVKTDYPLSNITVKGHYTDSSIKTLNSNFNWSYVSGPGTIENNIFKSGDIAGNSVLKCTYTEGEIIKSIDIPVTILNSTETTLSSINVEPDEKTIFSNETFDLNSLIINANYSDLTTVSRSENINFSMVSGSGTITDNIYHPASTNETSIIKVMYTENNISKYAYFVIETIFFDVNQLQIPVFNYPGGTYSTAKKIEITHFDSAATIKYTTDGTDPSETNGIVYSEAFTITENTTVKAIAIKSGMKDSEISRIEYIINIIPVVVPEMVEVEGGTFTLGDTWGDSLGYYFLPPDLPLSRVTLSTFYLGIYEITNSEFCIFLNHYGITKDGFYKEFKIYDNYSSNQDKLKIKHNGNEFTVEDKFKDYPVNFVTWYGAALYCNWLSDHEGLEKCYNEENFELIPEAIGFRLPTEAEWEFAARGGNLSKNSKFSGSHDIDEVAWYKDNSFNPDYQLDYHGRGLHIKGGKKANELDVFDLTGNVVEIVHNFQENLTEEEKVNPTGPVSGDYAMARGGGFIFHEYDCRISTRSHGSDLNYGGFFTGFRIAKNTGMAPPLPKVADPIIDLPEREYNSAQYINMKSYTPEASIKYTVDGSMPSLSNGIVYSEPILLSSSKTIKAIAIKTGYTDSEIIERSYTINIAPLPSPEMVEVDSGFFKMGYINAYNTSGIPLHDVILSKYSIGKYEITNDQFVEFLNDSKLTSTDMYKGNYIFKLNHYAGYIEHNEVEFFVEEGKNNHPASTVTWFGAMLYCNWLSEKHGLDKCYDEDTLDTDFSKIGYRLPTEAEWEFAYKGGNLSQNYVYSGGNDIEFVSWNVFNSGHRSHIAGTKEANELGIYDMSGNVSEWTNDWYDVFTKETITNPTGPLSGKYKVLRGFNYDEMHAYQKYVRVEMYPYAYEEFIGFRIVLPSNETAEFVKLENPQFNIPAGIINPSQAIIITSSNPDDTIRYTTDNSNPSSTNGFIYTNPININATTTIKAISIKSGSLNSEIVSNTYIISTVPVTVPAMIRVEGGSFDEGDTIGYSYNNIDYFEDYNPNRMITRTTLSSFYIGKYEITNREFTEFLNNYGISANGYYGVTYNGYYKEHKIIDLEEEFCPISHNGNKFIYGSEKDEYPVSCVTWYGAAAYCNYLSINEGVDRCYDEENFELIPDATGFRLPTNAEWEFAAKGGNLTKNKIFSGSNDPREVAVFSENSYNTANIIHTDNRGYFKIGTKIPNELNIYDMSGNVKEWVTDERRYYKDIDFFMLNPVIDRSLVFHKYFRGGSWLDPYDSLIISNNHNNLFLSEETDKTTGFRIVKLTGEAPPVPTVSEPVFNLPEEDYEKAVSLKIYSYTRDCRIFYTLDGSTPSENNGIEYSTPVYISSTTTVNAIAVKDGFTDSKISQINLVINNESIPAPEMVDVESGSFIMGNINSTGDIALPTHEVFLSSFKIGKYEITNREFAQFLNESGARTDGRINDLEVINFDGFNVNISHNGTKFIINDDKEFHPVTSVSWIGAASFCNWLSTKNSMEKCYDENNWTTDFTKYGYRLPTEAEWEFAYRGGTQSKNYLYSGDNYMDNVGWYRLNTEKEFYMTGRKKSNELGIFDMAGNAEEWVNDWFGGYDFVQVTDPKGPSSGTYHTVRGGNFNLDNSYCTFYYRSTGNNIETTGFRVALPGGVAPQFTKLDTPSIEPSEGFYSTPQAIIITSSTPDAVIKYTIDGSIPNQINGLIYSSPINLIDSATIKVIATKQGMIDSDLVIKSYIIEGEDYADPDVVNYEEEDDGTLTVTGLKNNHPENVKIPPAINGKPVKKIKDGGFKNYNTIKSIVIPDSVCCIGKNAFENCSLLESITLPQDITTINEYSFYNCVNLVNITIPNGVVNIYMGAFAGCTSLTGIQLPEKLESIENEDETHQGAFENCTELDNVKIPDNCKKIGKNSFKNCKKLKNMKLSKNGKKIGKGAFKNCESLESIEIPETVDEIEDEAFNNCKNLQNAYFDGTPPSQYGNNVFDETGNGFRIRHRNGQPGWTNPWNGVETEEYSDIVEKVKCPQTNINPDKYYYPQKLELDSPTTDVIIKYTLDGTTPSHTNGMVYNGQIDISETTTVKAVAIKNGMIDSDVITETYYIDTVQYTPQENFEYVKENEGITIQGLKDYYPEVINIPPEIENMPVRKIDKNAFKDCLIQDIIIPDSVIDIAYSAFENCYNLVSVKLSISITVINEYTFYNCVNLTNIIIPEDVEEIKEGAFENCNRLNKMKIPGKCKKIGKGAYKNCNKLKDVKVPDSVCCIGNNAFENCTELETIILPSSITEINAFTFHNCLNLVNIIIPNGVVNIYMGALANCEKLKNVELPDTLQNIDNEDPEMPGPFENCKELETIIIPDNVNNIGKNGFKNCKKLKECKIPENCKKIGKNGFEGCKELEEIKIPESVDTIDEGAFKECTKLVYVYFDGTPPAIGPGAFDGTDDNAKLYYPEDKEWPETVENYPTQEYTYEYTEKNVFEYIDEGETITITKVKPGEPEIVNIPPYIDGKPVKKIDNNAAKDCPNVNKVIIPDTCDDLGQNAFDNCSNLQTVILSNNITVINAYTFISCINLVNITMPDGIVNIYMGAFENCSSLGNVSIPENVNSIGDNAFKNCNNLESVYFDGTPPGNLGNNVFDGTGSGFILYHTEDAEGWTNPWNGYQTLEYTIKYSSKTVFNFTEEEYLGITYIVIQGLREIASDHLYIPPTINGMAVKLVSTEDDETITKMTVPEGVRYVSCRGCINLTDVELPQTVDLIGVNSFEGCEKLKNVNIPQNVSNIDKNAFKNCSELEAVELPPGIEKLLEGSFQNCAKLKKITVGNEVQTVGDNAFQNCESLEYAEFEGDAPADFGTNVFDNCAPGFKIKHHSGRAGWTNPWNGYETEEID